MSYFAQNIKFLRNEKKLTAEEFKELCGLSVSVLMLENGNAHPSPEELLRIAEKLNYPLEKLIRTDLQKMQQKLKNFRLGLLALDIDGVLTDGGMYFTQNGDEFKKFNTKDGLAIIRLVQSGKQVAFISSGTNDNIIRNRAEFLGVQRVYVGTWKKREIIEKWCDELKISLAEVAYIGDDINDMEVIQTVGFSACPADAAYQVRQSVHIILESKGGQGAVREFIERFIMPL